MPRMGNWASGVAFTVPSNIYDDFNKPNNTALDSNKWQPYKARELKVVSPPTPSTTTLNAGSKADIQNNAAQIQVASNREDTAKLVEVGAYSKVKMASFATQSKTINFKTYPFIPFASGYTSLSFLVISPDLIANPTLNEGILSNKSVPQMVRISFIESTAGTYKARIHVLRNGESAFTSSNEAIITNLTIDDALSVDIDKTNIILKRNGSPIVSLTAIADIGFSDGYIYIGLLTDNSTLQTVSFDDINFPTA